MVSFRHLYSFNRYDPSRWTFEREKKLKEMYKKGCLMKEIAAALDTTTNAVAGKINRLGIKSRKRPKCKT